MCHQCRLRTRLDLPARIGSHRDLRSMMRLLARSIVLLVLAMFAVGCGCDTIGTGEDGGDFVGDDPSGSYPGGDPPESGQSAGSMFDPSTCENDEACTPTSQSIRVCEPEAV